MFNNIGIPGLLLIAVVVLVLFGKGKVSSLMGEVGKGITAFKKGVTDGVEGDRGCQGRGRQGRDPGRGGKGQGLSFRPRSGDTAMDLSWSELLVVGIVALIIIGPKDLPGMFRELGRFTAKVRAMGREFSRAMEAAAKESGVKDVADDLRKVTSAKAMGLDAVKSAADKFEKWDPLKNAAKPTTPLTPAPMPPRDASG